MIPLVVLLTAFFITLAIFKASKGRYELSLAARTAMSVMLGFTAIAHFKFTEGMVMMIPDFIPYKEALVFFIGIIELLFAFCLFF